MNESVLTLLIFSVLVAAIAVPYWIRAIRHRRQAAAARAKNLKADLLHPATLHPRIELTTCIGCASCVRACPEDVLGIVEGRAAIVNGLKCVGHAICVDVCPVGAITMGFGPPRQGMEIPEYDDHFESNVPGLYIAGELGGVGLIRNAVAQGLKVVQRIASHPVHPPRGGYNVVIVGGGPAGLTAALACKERNLRYVLLEQDEIGGSLLHYPRGKLVLTAPVDLPLYGRLKVSEISKEELLAIWREIVRRFALEVLTRHKVDAIERAGDHFVVTAGSAVFPSSSVILAIGRRGSPRKLGVPGEELPKVLYRLIEAESYAGKHVLVVGGGDSAVEAAIGLANQKGNTVTLSYRREDFVRLKEKNEKRVREFIASRRLKALFNSTVTEIRLDSVLVQQERVTHTLQNDAVFVFAGGELPTDLLKRAGVGLRSSEVSTRAA